MITSPSGLIANMDSMTRNPTAKLFVSWDTVLASGEWFRLDQSYLDSGAILSQYNYLNGQTIIEGLSDVDSRIYEEESEYIMSLEGYAELLGDSYQYSIADMDVELDNSNNRFTPRNNKNKLANPGFEFNKNSWNEVVQSSGVLSIDETDQRLGIRDLQIYNPAFERVYSFSDVIILSNDPNNAEVPLVSAQDEYWTFSFYVSCSGMVNLSLLGYDLSASGVHDITTGYRNGATENFYIY